MMKMKVTLGGSWVAFCGEDLLYVDVPTDYASVQMNRLFRGVSRNFKIYRRRMHATAAFIKLEARVK